MKTKPVKRVRKASGKRIIKGLKAAIKYAEKNSTVSRTLAADTSERFLAENSTAGVCRGQQEVTPQVDNSPDVQGLANFKTKQMKMMNDIFNDTLEKSHQIYERKLITKGFYSGILFTLTIEFAIWVLWECAKNG